MKKIVLIIVMLGTFFLSHAQVELKGYTLGTVYDGDLEINTTVGGVEGAIFIMTLDDKRIHSIIFNPYVAIDENKQLFEADIDAVKNGLENKYGITFIKKMEDDYSKDYTYKVTKDGVTYMMIVKLNEFDDVPCTFILAIINNELRVIFDQEEQARVNKDF